MRFCPRCRSVYAAPVAHCGLDGERIVEQEKDPLIGEVLDRYRIVERIGEGGMGIVYRATHTVISREYAIKVLFGELASNAMFVERMRREARAVSLMRHPNIVIVEDFGATPSGIHFLVMELVEGRTLHQVIKREAPFSLARAAGIARQIAAALGEAHRLGFVHRDLKPSNIMMTRGEDRVKVLDFGVVAQQERDETQAQLTAVGAIIGTPMYMAPEQSDSQFTSAVDLYSLGVILYEMIVGRPPFTGSPKELIKKHLTDPPPPLGPAHGLEKLVARLLDKSPSERPDSYDVMAALDDIEFTETTRPETLIVPSSVSDVEAPENTLPSDAPVAVEAPAMDVADDLVLAAPPVEPATIAAPEPAKKNAPLLTKDRMLIERNRGQPTPAPTPVRAQTPAPAPILSPVALPLATYDIPRSGPSFENEPQRSRAPAYVGAVVLLALAAGAWMMLLRTDNETVEITDLTDLPPVRTDTATVAVMIEDPPLPPLKRPPIDGTSRLLAAEDDPAISVLEVDLQQALSERGLTIADLDALASVAPAAKRWRNATKDHRVEATRALIAEVERAPITTAFLRAKLKRVGETLAALTRDERLKELRARHEHIGSLVRSGSSQDDNLGLSLMISILEDDTRRLAEEK